MNGVPSLYGSAGLIETGLVITDSQSSTGENGREERHKEETT